MNLHVVGTHHYDPLCRARLGRLITHLVEVEGQPPAIVAPEWHGRVFASIKAQRSRFRQLIKEKWPEAPADFVEALGNTIGFEADTHTEQFPDTQVLWLDQGREVDADVDPRVLKYPERTLDIYSSILDHWPTSGRWNLAALSATLWNHANKQLSPENVARDVDMAEILFGHLRDAGDGWVLAVVGAVHAGRDCSIVSFAEDMRCPYKVHLLDPNFSL